MKSSRKSKTRFELDRLTEYTNDNILAEIRRVADIVDKKKLTKKDFQKHARVGLTTVSRRFGNWRAALSAAGLQHLYYNVPPARISAVESRKWSKQDVIAELLRVAEQLGKKTLTVDEFRANACIGPDIVRNRFGSWNAALRASNLRSVAHARRYSAEECFENLLTVWTQYGRPPKYQEMNREPSVVGGKAYAIRWGTWNKALAAFVEFANQDDPPLPSPRKPLSTVPSCNISPHSTKPKQVRYIPLRLRIRVFARDRYRCKICGRSPANELGCEIHIDHIKPLSKGGETVEDNLQVLCKECNLGKGDLVL